jgi:NAD(P)-dependent dehydrogenase (short-subunit alcohol dehydrogenase family)
MNRLENKVAVVTGAASGLGRAISLSFASEGAKIVAGDINDQALSDLKKEVTANKGTITTVAANMAKAEDIENLIKTAVTAYGTVDILVNNAGIMDDFSPVGDVQDQIWDRVIAVNLSGPFKAMRSAIQIMLEKKSGVIINISSLGGLQGARAGAAYTASKHALVGLTKNTGYLYAKSGIRCNAIAPGAMGTHIGSTIDFTKISPLVNERIMPGMALNPRTSNPSEVAQIALFLASDAASFVNGAVIVADGGWSAY